MQDVIDSTGMETRLTVWGTSSGEAIHTMIDRVNATKMGFQAADLLKDGIGNRIIAEQNNKIVAVVFLKGSRCKKPSIKVCMRLKISYPNKKLQNKRTRRISGPFFFLKRKCDIILHNIPQVMGEAK